MEIGRGRTKGFLRRFRPDRPPLAGEPIAAAIVVGELTAEPAVEPIDEPAAAGAGVAGSEPVDEAAAAVVATVVAAPQPVVAPEPLVTAVPVAATEPEPVAAPEPIAAEPEPEPVVEAVTAEPEPEPVVEAVTAAVVAAVVATPEPEPVDAPEPEPVVAAEPIAPQPVAAPEPEPVVGAPAAPMDTIEQPTWRILAPEAGTTTPERWPEAPAWPTNPQAPVSGGTPGPGASPWAARLATARPEPTSVWAASAQEVLGGPVGPNAPQGAPAVQACISCGLSLSANARFCRRCGTRQS